MVPGGERAVVQWVRGKEEEVGMVASCRGIRGEVGGGLLAGNASSAEGGGTKCGLGDEERVHFLVYPRVKRRARAVVVGGGKGWKVAGQQVGAVVAEKEREAWGGW